MAFNRDGDVAIPAGLIPGLNALGQPRNNRVAVLGHSKTGFNSVAGALANNWRSLANGWLTWARVLSGQRVKFLPANDFSYAGDTTGPSTRSAVTYPGILTRTAAALLASDAATWILQLTTNDSGSVNLATGATFTAADTIANVTAIVNMILAAGRNIILLTDDPRGDSTFTGNRLASPSPLNQQMQVNRFVMNLNDTPGIDVVNTWDVVANYTSGFGDIQTLMTYDGLHQVQTMAYRIGVQIAAIFNRMFPPVRNLPMANVDAYAAATNVNGNLVTQPYVGGTGGTLVTGTGSIATGWTEAIAPATSLAAVYSKITGAASFNGVTYPGSVLKDWQQIVVSGTPSVAAEVPIFRQKIAAGSLAIGDVLRAFAEVEVDSMTGLSTFSLRLWSVAQTLAYSQEMGGTTSIDGFVMPNVAWSGIFQPFDAVINNVDCYLDLCVKTIASTAAAATVRVRGIGAVKVI